MRGVRFVTAVYRRFVEVAGFDQSGVLSIELFTTIIPLIVIGFAFFSGFAADTSVGELVIKQMNVGDELAETVRRTFESADRVRSVWSIAEMASFLIWCVPMSLSITGVFARAWRREPFPVIQRILRGILWFALYLVTVIAAVLIVELGTGTLARAGLFVLSGIPYFVFWSLTPLLLLRGGRRDLRYLAAVGLAGVIVDSLALRFTARVVFPILLAGWTDFGPIGVAMALMTWCGLIGVGWVVTASIGAVLSADQADPRPREATSPHL